MAIIGALTLDLASWRTHHTWRWLKPDNLFDNWRLGVSAKNVLLSAEGSTRNEHLTDCERFCLEPQILIWWISFLVILLDIWSGWTNLESNQALNILIPPRWPLRPWVLPNWAKSCPLIGQWRNLIGWYWQRSFLQALCKLPSYITDYASLITALPVNI